MPTWPGSPVPNSTEMLSPLRQLTTFQADSGFQLRRTRGIRARRRFQLTYLGLTADEATRIAYFMSEEIDNGAAPFDWVERSDNSIKVLEINAGTVNVSPYHHGLSPGWYVRIDHSTTYSSTVNYQVNTVPTANHFTLVGQSASDFSGNLRFRHSMPSAYVTLTGSNEVPSMGKQLGPRRDRKGVFSYVIGIEES